MYTPTYLGHPHFTSYFPFQDLPISISHFSKFRFTAKINLSVSVFLQFEKTFPSILLSVELFLANIGNSVPNLKFRFIYLFQVKTKNHWL